MTTSTPTRPITGRINGSKIWIGDPCQLLNEEDYAKWMALDAYESAVLQLNGHTFAQWCTAADGGYPIYDRDEDTDGGKFPREAVDLVPTDTATIIVCPDAMVSADRELAEHAAPFFEVDDQDGWDLHISDHGLQVEWYLVTWPDWMAKPIVFVEDDQ